MTTEILQSIQATRPALLKPLYVEHEKLETEYKELEDALKKEVGVVHAVVYIVCQYFRDLTNILFRGDSAKVVDKFARFDLYRRQTRDPLYTENGLKGKYRRAVRRRFFCGHCKKMEPAEAIDSLKKAEALSKTQTVKDVQQLFQNAAQKPGDLGQLDTEEALKLINNLAEVMQRGEEELEELPKIMDLDFGSLVFMSGQPGQTEE